MYLLIYVTLVSSMGKILRPSRTTLQWSTRKEASQPTWWRTRSRSGTFTTEPGTRSPNTLTLPMVSCPFSLSPKNKVGPCWVLAKVMMWKSKCKKKKNQKVFKWKNEYQFLLSNCNSHNSHNDVYIMFGRAGRLCPKTYVKNPLQISLSSFPL